MSVINEEDFLIMEENNHYHCDHCCNDIVSGQKFYRTRQYQFFCEKCAKEQLVKCEVCNDIVYHRYTQKTLDTNKIVCHDCIDRFPHCYECGAIYEFRSNMFDNLEHVYCENHRHNGFIHQYNFKPEANFMFGKNEVPDNSGLVIGFELEVENRNGNLTNGQIAEIIDQKINQKFFKGKPPFLYFKRDGSLSHGFEVVSQPFSEKFFKENIKIFELLLKILQDNKCASHDTDTCGLHFHINRKFLKDENDTELPVDKMILFTEYYKEKIQLFSRRNNYHYCKFFSEYIMAMRYNEKKAKNIKIIQDNKRNSDRYSVVNLRNFHTVELRVFRGTLKPQTFFATVEFVYNLANTCKNFPIKKISWNKIVNNEKSKYIKEYCKMRNIPEDRKFMRDFSLDYVKELNKQKRELKTLQKNILLDLFDMYYGFMENNKTLTKTQINKIINTKEADKKVEVKKSFEITQKIYISQIISLIAESFYRENDFDTFYSIVCKIYSIYRSHKKIFYALKEKNHIEEIKNNIDKSFMIYREIRRDLV